MVSKALFSKYDVYSVIESQKRRLKEACLRLPEDEAMDEDAIQRIKAEYMLDVPVLKTDEMYCVENKTKIDVSRNPTRIFFGTGPVMEDATELIVHIPFDGDPGVFNIAPSAYNSRIAQGEVKGNEVLLRVIVSNGNYDVQGHIDREVAQINWALTQLREKTAYASQELEGALRQAVATRKRSIESRGNVMGNLKIPVRSLALPRTLTSPTVPQKEMPEPAVPDISKRAHRWEVFISHASEDKPYVEPLAKALDAAGVSVWYDKTSIGWGDDIRASIDNGLLNCDYGVVVFSKAFLGKKKWTEYEVSALFGLETVDKKRILPIWHEVTYEDVMKYSPALAQRRAKSSADDSNDEIVKGVLSMLGRRSMAEESQPTRLNVGTEEKTSPLPAPAQKPQQRSIRAGGTVIRSAGNRPFVAKNFGLSFSRDFQGMLEVAETSDFASLPRVSADQLKRIDFIEYSAAEIALIKKSDPNHVINYSAGWSRFRKAKIQRLDGRTEEVFLMCSDTLYGLEGESYNLGNTDIQAVDSR